MIAFLPPRVGFARRRLDLGGRRACPQISGDCSVPGRAGLPAPKPLLAAGPVLEIAGGFCLATALGGPFPPGVGRIHHCGVVHGAQLLAYSGDEREALRTGFTNVAVLGGLIVAATTSL